MSADGSPSKESFTAVVRRGVERMCKEFSVRLDPLGFQRTRKMLWTRRHEHTVDFIDLFRKGSSYGAARNASVSMRIYCSIRILNDDFPTIPLIGPNSDDLANPQTWAARYHMRFNAETWSTFDRCINDMERFVKEIGEPWFFRLRDPKNLFELPNTVLKPTQKALLQASIDGNRSDSNVAASKKLLGLT
jgi:hypothetical protein